MSQENEEIDSDNESIATADIQEELIPEQPEQPESEPLPEVKNEVESEQPNPAPVKKKRGPKPGSKKQNEKTTCSLTSYTKQELVELLTAQHEVLKKHEMVQAEKEKFLKSRIENKPAKVKRERTQAQKDATARLVEANKARRQAKLDSIASDVKADLEKSVSELVQDEVVKIIQAPMRTLTPERVRKIKKVEEVALSKYKSSF
jgi:hypothetical protein